MRFSLSKVMLATIAVGVGGCSDAPTPTRPEISAPTGVRADRAPGQHTMTVQMMDDCDPVTFDQAVGPGTCVKKGGGVTFDKFVGQLTHLQMAPAWKFAPSNVMLHVGDILASTNVGGEVHTFTEVKEFGGGVIPFLNDLSGTPIPTAECLALPPSGFLAPGGSTSEVENDAGDEKYQCCIHPWMRAVVHISAK